MKRFYKDVAVEQTPQGFRLLLDGKPVQTPARRSLLLPSRALADGVADEWRGQGEEMQPTTMPLTRLAHTVLDGVSMNRSDMIAAILRFGENDLLCYRADRPAEFAQRQGQWDAHLDWAAERFGARLLVTTGLAPVEQPAEAIASLRRAVEAQDDFALATLHVLASITGSLVLGLAALEGRLAAAHAFALSRLDEAYQAERWGRDPEADERAHRLAQDMENAARLVRLSRT
jgi:chaperone required for assembly of F1-ATPase